MSIITDRSSIRHFTQPFDSSELETWAADEREKLGGSITFATCFISPKFVENANEILEIIQIYAQTNAIIGCTSSGLVANSREIESEAGFTVTLYALPETEANVFYFPSGPLSHLKGTSFNQLTNSDKADYNAWLLFASPQNMDSESWLQQWDEQTQGAVTVGGFASANSLKEPCLIFHNGAIYDEGAVAVGLRGRVTIEPVISQGCRPVGMPWPVTEAELNVIHKIGNRPILEVLRDTLEEMSHADQDLARGNIFIGLVMDEYKSSFGTGDFLVRNLAAIDPESGAVAIATPPRVGQNLQFQIRDAQTASIDLEQLLKGAEARIAGRKIYGGCLVDCIGRGASLYGEPNHDVSAIRDVFPELSLSGLFCNGEFGPTKGSTRLHGYAASLGLFVDTA